MEEQPQTITIEPTTNKYRQNNFLIILLFVLLIVSCIFAGFFAWQTQKLTKELSTHKKQIEQNSTVTETPISDSDINWQTILNPSLGYQIKLPLNWKVVEHSPNFDNVFEIYQSDSGQKVEFVKNKIPKIICKGDCPIVEQTTKTNINQYKATKYEGYIGEIGGEIAHRYISYNVVGTSYSLDITFHPSTNGKVPGSEIISIKADEEKLFDQILSTFKFLDIQATPTPTVQPKQTQKPVTTTLTPKPSATQTPNLVLPAPNLREPSPTVTITSPNGGETIKNGTYATITWNSSGTFSFFELYSLDCDTCSAKYITTVNGNENLYKWWYLNLEASTLPTQKKIKIVGIRSDTQEDKPFDTSNNFFNIVE